MKSVSLISRTMAVIAGLSPLLAAVPTSAQDSSLLLQPAQSTQQLTVEQGSFLHRQLPPGTRMRELQTHDIITVLFDYRTRMLSEGDAENRKTSSLTAVLSSWLRFDGKSIKAAPQADGDPRVAGTLNSQYRTESDVELRESLTLEIAAEILEVRPNGNLYVEGNQLIRINEEEWRVFISGEVSRESIQPDRTVSSKQMAKIHFSKEEAGQVRDGYARGWFNKWYDKYKPF